MREEEGDRAALCQLLRARKHRTVVVADAVRALAALAEGRFGWLLVDLAMGDEALRVARAAGRSAAAPRIVALADRRRPHLGSEALAAGVRAILPRPVTPGELDERLRSIGELSAGAAVSGPPDPPLASPVLAPGLRDLVAQLPPLACERANILIVGERGSGRSVVARAIHAKRLQVARSLALVDCASLCGSAASATPGESSAGALAAALAGPVFLREVHELGPAAQQALVSLLDARADAVSAGEPAPPPVLASAAPELADKVTQGRFLAALFERLAVVRIDVPPLRERPHDIPVLAEAFLAEACARHGLVPKRFAPPARTLLAALPWRGNAAELGWLIERLALLVPHDTVQLEDLLAHVSLDGAALRASGEGTLRAARQRFEREFILAAVHRHQGRVGSAARELGLNRTNLYRKMKQLGLRGA